MLIIMLQSAHDLERDLFWHYPHYHAGGDGPYSAVRSGDWRLIEFLEDGKLELYNLKHNLSESTDLAERYPEKRDQLKGKLDGWRKSVSAQMPFANPNFDPDRQTEVRGANE
jgi:arylsulfatase A